MKKALLTALAGLCLLQAGLPTGFAVPVLETGSPGPTWTGVGLAEVDSLSQLFGPGKAVLDLDGDGFPEKPAVTIIIPDKPTAREVALAADIAARVNFESLAVDFGLVRRESEVASRQSLPFPILIGNNLAWVREALKERRLDPVSLGPNRGLVFLFARKNQRGIACVAGSDEALLRTGRAFFLRWPYFWEVWGRETGATYMSFENDLTAFLAEAGVKFQKTVVRDALYEFPVDPGSSDGLRALSFDQGQIKNLGIEIHFTEDGDRKKAQDALLLLERQQLKGVRTGVLSYPACAALTFELCFGDAKSQVILPRIGATKRLLTPGFKERPGAEGPGKEFDLLGLFSTKGVYSDQDKDGIPDALDSSIVIPDDFGSGNIAELSSRLVLATAGASFPLVQLQAEVESRKALAAPILVGDNALTLDLIKTGKLKPPALASAGGLVKIVPKAFGKSSALVVYAPGPLGLDKTLSYLARTFPYFEEYGEGKPQLADLAADIDKFLSGEKGAAEAFLMNAVEKTAAELKGRDLESIDAELLLPGSNVPFEAAVGDILRNAAGNAAVSVKASTLREGRAVFEKSKEFTWEVDDALALIREKVGGLAGTAGTAASLMVSLGVSESPGVREKVRGEVEKILRAAGYAAADVEVVCAYKPGYFWLVEKVLPALRGKSVHHISVRFAEEREDFTRPKRAYAEPSRWLQELYPVDEILARELAIPLDRIEFEVKEPGGPVYEIRAYDDRNAVLLDRGFTPRTRDIPLSNVFPEWGTAKVTCGWLRIEAGGSVVCDLPLETDLEKFWAFYQEDVLKAVAGHVRKKTSGEPTFSKQPYFKRLLVDVQASEPDYRIGLDEEIISSLEALHDEIYFDTLDLLRGITHFDPEDKDLPADTSRSSAPGNVLPSLHPSLEGGPARARVVLEDWPAAAPQMTVRWKEKGHEEVSRKTVFPTLKPKETRTTELVYDGRTDRIANVVVETDWEKEADYLALIDIVSSWRKLFAAGALGDVFGFPKVEGFTLRLLCQTLEKDENFKVVPPPGETPAAPPPPRPEETVVTTREIISPVMARDLIRRLSSFKAVRSYIGGRSYEGRDVPVLELFLPFEKYVSLPRLITFKPTLQVVARQHANEVSSTNYLLRFAELVARDPVYREALKKMNFVLQPLENPDGAEAAYEMQKNEPFHSLHAGRYGSLGVDIGYQTGAKPLLPEAAVRTKLYEKWSPDIFLNLHGYPSHEWVQPFSNYSPYLFRDYRIPKGWFTYFKALRLPLYAEDKAAGDALMKLIARELQGDARFAASNKKFQDRYERWAARWAPHMNTLETADGVNIYAKRRGPSENRLTPRAQTTFVEQTPEVMDETATGDWLDFLCEQGLAYLRAHVKYLARTGYEVVRIEEEGHNRTRLTFVRGRPGQTPESPK
ncbi:MAG: M14 family metallopeptidase [Candidatus Aminicenantes bacterium]|nr:M14 family metallopeptidase [Candidatus Aminicenantes bacterium]